jgi:hypothetical protein
MSSWGEVKNIGLPYNSPADDLHFSLLADGKSGWLTSNRIFESEKGVTTDNDIFHFSAKATILTNNGKVWLNEFTDFNSKFS